jgi:two-component system cell cycle response regulator DivK
MAGELILIVEDNEQNMKLVRDLLQVKGYRTLEAGTAERGLELARAHAPDLVLMDIQLPGMDGVSALRALRSEPATASVLVAAFTASAMKSDRERIVSAGFDAYLSKPIEVREFLASVRALCERRSAGAP